MREWALPIFILVAAAAVLAYLNFHPDIFLRSGMISPLSDTPSISGVSPTRNPLTSISTPAPVSVTDAPSPTPIPQPTSSGISSITLSAQKISSDSARLIWTIDGLASEGFAVLSSPDSAPTFPTRPGDLAKSSYDPQERQYTLTGLSGTVYIRVCEFTQNTCGTYSNQITLNF